jgi:hypothetical protein
MTTQYVQPDILYLKDREDLLQFEDASEQRLLNGTANFYLTRNDQSIWGTFFRAVAQELAKLEYDYAYDLVAKNPQYLTPPDIDRRWSKPLFISSAYPATTANDLPDGQSDLSYRNMLVALLAAYKEGATVKAIQDVIFAYTGIQVVVQELYTQIGNGVYDQSDRNAIRVSLNVGGNNPLADITTLNQLQLIVSSLYTAIDLTKPAHVGLEFTTVFGSDENIDAYTQDISLITPSETENGADPGIADTLTVLFRLIENPPFNPMLYQAPVTSPNPNTTIAPYGRQFAGSLLTLTSAQWNALPSITFNVTQTSSVAVGQNLYTGTFAYDAASYELHEGMQVTIQGTTNGGGAFNITGKISDLTYNLTGSPPAPDLTSGTFTMVLGGAHAAQAESGTGLVTPTIQSAYVVNGSSYTVGMANWAPSTAFFKGQFIMDTNGNTQMALNTGVSGATLPTFNFALASSAGVFSGSTKYNFLTSQPAAANNGLAGRTFTITGFGNPDNNGTFYCLASSPTQITLQNVAGVAEIHSANAAVSAWSLTQNGATTDNTITWRMIGFGQVYNPSYLWIMLLQPGVASITPGLPPTGEIGNWDITHPMGLVAPRLKQAWEISGGDTFQSFEMN